MTNREFSEEEIKKFDEACEMFRVNFNLALDSAGYPEIHYGRQVEVAKDFKISTSAARKWVVGECIPDWKNLIFIADKLNISIDALLGRAVKLKGRRVKTKARKTDGSGIYPKSNITIHADVGWIENGMRLKYNGLQIYLVTSNSMSPTLDEGDTILVDALSDATATFEPQGTYLFARGDVMFIRRVVTTDDKMVRLTSDNLDGNNEGTILLPTTDQIGLQSKLAGNGTTDDDQIVLIGKITMAIKKTSGTIQAAI